MQDFVSNSFTENAFPECVVTVIQDHFEGVETVDLALARPLKPTDPNFSIGVFADDWTPFGHEIGASEPTIARYQFVLQGMTKHSSQEEGRKDASLLAKSIRLMLYRDQALQVSLRGLREESMGAVERLQRFGVSRQRFLANEIKGMFLFLSMTDIWAETETV